MYENNRVGTTSIVNIYYLKTWKLEQSYYWIGASMDTPYIL